MTGAVRTNSITQGTDIRTSSRTTLGRSPQSMPTRMMPLPSRPCPEYLVKNCLNTFFIFQVTIVWNQINFSSAV